MSKLSFPFRAYTDKQLHAEYDRLIAYLSKPFTVDPIPYSRIGYPCSNYFFQHARMNMDGRGKRGNAIEFYNKNKKRIDTQSTKLSRDIFSCINFTNHQPSQFSPMVAGRLYLHFQAGSVLDIYAGWGDRCLAAMALDIDYVGIDSNPELVDAYDKMIDKYPHQGDVRFISGKCEDVDIESLMGSSEYIIFTSPPFFEKVGAKTKLVERYPNCETDYKTFMTNSLIPMFERCSGAKVIAIYMSEFMYRDVCGSVGECNDVIVFNNNNGGAKPGSVYCWYR